MNVTKEIGIDYGHVLPPTYHNAQGVSKCSHFHGHRAKVIVEVEGNIVDEQGHPQKGMVICFSDLKQAMMDVIDAPYDHGFMVWKEDPRCEALKEAAYSTHPDDPKFHLVDFVPTAENLSKHWFSLLSAELRSKYRIRLVKMTVYETPTSAAICTEADV